MFWWFEILIFLLVETIFVETNLGGNYGGNYFLVEKFEVWIAKKEQLAI